MCVAVWKDGADNGGATYQGVTKDSIDVVVLVPNDQQLAARVRDRGPVDHAPAAEGTVTNAFKDTFAAFEHQGAPRPTAGKINLVFVTSSGDDETAQRADAVAVKARKPFAVIDGTLHAQAGVRHRSRGGEDPGLREHHLARSDVEAGAVPVGRRPTSTRAR